MERTLKSNWNWDDVGTVGVHTVQGVGCGLCGPMFRLQGLGSRV